MRGERIRPVAVAASGPRDLGERRGGPQRRELGVSVAATEHAAEALCREGPGRAVVGVAEVESHLPRHVAAHLDVHGDPLRLPARRAVPEPGVAGVSASTRRTCLTRIWLGSRQRHL